MVMANLIKMTMYQIKILDWQTVCPSHPAFDILTMLITCVNDQQLRVGVLRMLLLFQLYFNFICFKSMWFAYQGQCWAREKCSLF